MVVPCQAAAAAAAARRSGPRNYRGGARAWGSSASPLAPRRRAAAAIMAAPLALVLVVAVTVRAALFRSSLAEFISERVEVVSPLSSWKRGEATGSSRRPGPCCALGAAVNGRRGSGRQHHALTRSGALRGRAGGRGLRTRLPGGGGEGLFGEGWAPERDCRRDGDLRGCVPLGP